jgi:amidase
MEEVLRADATEQAQRIRRKEVSPAEVVEAAIARIEKVNSQLNAVISPLYDRARLAAASPELPDGPFRGVPFLLKDLFCESAGDPYHAGMTFLRDLTWISPGNSYLATKFRQAGFVLVGKTNVPELGPLPTTEPLAHGPTHNPWDATRSPGGSSGGSAAAVAAGMVAAAHGNDGGGSIRVPSSACGLVGLKPSRGRTSLGPRLGESWHGLVAEHVLTRTVRDTAGILDAVAGPMPGDPYFAPPPARPFREEVGRDPGQLRVGLMIRAPGGEIEVHPECIRAAEETARLLEARGHRVEPDFPRALDDAGAAFALVKVIASWTARDLDDWSERTGRKIGSRDVEPYTWALAEMGRELAAPDYIAAVQVLHTQAREMAVWWAKGFDLLVTPTMAELPPRLGQFSSTPDEPLAPLARSGPMCTFTAAFNATGQPAISLPLHWSDDGLPVGVQLAAAYPREDLLLQVAAQLEEQRPWHDRRPSIHA